MPYQDYIIEYTAQDNNGVILKKGKIRAKNRLSELDAKIKFEEHLIKKLPSFKKLIVHKCYLDNPISEIFSDLKDMAKIFE